jgi:hypothetical protein
LRDLLVTSEAKGKAEGVAVGKVEGVAEGEARGKAAAVLMVLASRGVPAGEAAHAQILACRDGSTLDRWLAHAASVQSADELWATATS